MWVQRKGYSWCLWSILRTENQNQNSQNYWRKKKPTLVDVTPTESDVLDFTFPFLPSDISVRCHDWFGTGGSSRGRSPVPAWSKRASCNKADATCADICLGSVLHPGIHWVGLYPLWPPRQAGTCWCSPGLCLEQPAGVCAAQHLVQLFSGPLWGSCGPKF